MGAFPPRLRNIPHCDSPESTQEPRKTTRNRRFAPWHIGCDLAGRPLPGATDMVPKLFEILFTLALAAPPLAVVMGIAILFVPTRARRASKSERRIPAAA
jgi:hypothetical protein